MQKEEMRTRKREEEKVQDYFEELMKAKMEQAEMRIKSSKYWVFENPKTNEHKKR